MTTVKELIQHLQKYDQDAIVLYAYDENGDTGVHDFIDDSVMTVLNKDGDPIMELGELVEIITLDTNSLLEGLKLIGKTGGILKPAIKLFSR